MHKMSKFRAKYGCSHYPKQLFSNPADNLYVSQAVKRCGDPKALEVSQALKNNFDIVESDNASCDEIWDKAFQVMDSYESVEHGQEDAKHYHLRQTIEQATGRAIPWILQAPISDTSKQGDATETREKVYKAIHELQKNFEGQKGKRISKTARHRFILVCLDPKKEPPSAWNARTRRH